MLFFWLRKKKKEEKGARLNQRGTRGIILINNISSVSIANRNLLNVNLPPPFRLAFYVSSRCFLSLSSISFASRAGSVSISLFDGIAIVEISLPSKLSSRFIISTLL
jgi:hypothetical protein